MQLQILRLAGTVATALLAAGISGCSTPGARNAVPAAGNGALTGFPTLRLARERVAIREFSDLPEYSGFYVPTAIASGPETSLWVTDDIDQDFGECAVVRIATSGKLIKAYYCGGVTSEGVSFDDITEGPDGAQGDVEDIAAGPDEALWFTEFSGNAIGRITKHGKITEYSKNLTPNSDPTSIVRAPNGNMWFVETGADRTGRVKL